MPFTVSHVAAVLPFTGGRLRRWFDPTALVIGAMVPDLPLFFPGVLDYGWSHDLPLGPPTYDLVLGLVVFVLWTVLLRRPLSDLAPGPLRNRLPPAPALRTSNWLVVAVSIVLGAFTHALWDTFTHANRMGSQWFPALDAMIGPLPLYKWLQFGSGAFGLAVLVVWSALWWRRTPPRQSAPLASANVRRLAWLGVLGAAALAAVGVATAGVLEGLSLERIAFLAVTRAGAAAMVAVLICGGAWWLTTRGPTAPGPEERESTT